jgi:hypothetical protein
MTNKVIGWDMWEEIGIGIPNPRACIRFPKPDWMSQEEFERLITHLEAEAAKKEAEEQVEYEQEMDALADSDMDYEGGQDD